MRPLATALFLSLLSPLGATSKMPSPWESQALLAEATLVQKGVKKGSLFSALGFADSELGVLWGALRSEAQRSAAKRSEGSRASS